MKKFLSLFLVLTLIFPHSIFAKDIIEEMFSGRKKSAKALGCYDFSKPNKLPGPPVYLSFSRGPKKTKHKLPECEQELYKEYLKAAKDVSDANDEYSDAAKMSTEKIVGIRRTWDNQSYKVTGLKWETKTSERKVEKKADAKNEAYDKKLKAQRIRDEKLNLWRALCRNDGKKERSACPEVKANFEANPSLENFELLIKTVDGVVFGNDANNLEVANITLDDFNDKSRKKELKNKIGDDYRFEQLERKSKKAQTAWDNYNTIKSQIENPNKTSKAKPETKRVESICGGCSDLEQLIEENSANPDSSKDNLKIIELAQRFNCKVPKLVDCDDEPEGTNFVELYKRWKKSPKTFEDIESLKSSYKKLNSEIDKKTGMLCMSCEEIIKDITVTSKTLEPDFTKYQDFLTQINCPVPASTKPSCQEIVQQVNAVTTKEDFNPEALSSEDLERISLSQEMQCCSELKTVNDFKNGLESILEFDGVKVINENDNRFKVSKFLGCVECDSTENVKPFPVEKKKKEEINDCQYYKENKGTLQPFVCSSGPMTGDKCTNGNALFTSSAYGQNGKYGKLFDFNLQCYCDPRDGEAVNLTCCDLTPEEKQQRYKPSSVVLNIEGTDQTINSVDAVCTKAISFLDKKYSEYMKKRSAVCYEIIDGKRSMLGSIFSEEVEIKKSSSSHEDYLQPASQASQSN